MDKRNKILFLILVLQLVVVGYLFWPAVGQLSTPVVSLYDGLQVADVSGVTITDGTDNKHLKISRAGKNAWQLKVTDSLPPFPADPNKIESFIGKIAGLQADRLVTKTKASHERLQVAVDHFNRKIQLTLRDGGQRVLYLGSSPNYKTTHVRDAEHDEVYLVGDLSAWEANADHSSWWQKRYVNVAVQDVRRVQVKNLHGSFELAKVSGDWQIAPRPASDLSSADGIADFIDGLCHINLQDIIIDKQLVPSFAPTVSVSITTAGETFTIDFWSKGKGGKGIVVKSSRSPFYVIDSSPDIKSLVAFPELS